MISRVAYIQEIPPLAAQKSIFEMVASSSSVFPAFRRVIQLPISIRQRVYYAILRSADHQDNPFVYPSPAIFPPNY